MEKREETDLKATGVVAKTEPSSGQNSCCFWSTAQRAWSNAVWENDRHHADWTFLTWPLHLDSAQCIVLLSHPVFTFPKPSAAYLYCVAY